MRIATWNINGLRARLDFVLHWLEARQPDLVGLQELKSTDDQFPSEIFLERGYHSATLGQKAWNGVAVLSREPIAVRQSGLPGQEEMGARLLGVESQGLDFTTLYCPNGKHLEHDDYPLKLAWLDALAEHLEKAHDPGAATVVCGDFNVCPAPVDSWSEETLGGTIFHTEEERSRFRRLLDWGLCDLFRELQPDSQVFSWWDYRGGAFHRGMGLRIDFLLGSRAVLERTRSVETDRDYRKKKEGLIASDHAPVIAELE